MAKYRNRVEIQFLSRAKSEAEKLIASHPKLQVELDELTQTTLQANPEYGESVGRFRKIRLKNPDAQKGKSGGFRVWTEPKKNLVSILWILPKDKDEKMKRSQRIKELNQRLKQAIAESDG